MSFTVKAGTGIAGFGFRQEATLESLRSALRAALEQCDVPITLTALATAADKVDASAFIQLVAELNLPVVAVPLEQLSVQPASLSAHVPPRYGARSLAESSALAAAGPSARLAAKRCRGSDHMASAAIAIAVTTSIPENMPL